MENADVNLWDRAIWPTFEEFVSVDSAGKFFANSLQEFIDDNSQANETYWQDELSDIVWMKVSAGDLERLTVPGAGEESEFSDITLYNPFSLRIW